MSRYIVSDEQLSDYRFVIRCGDEAEREQAEKWIREFVVPDALMDAICMEPWEYRDKWLKYVRRVAYKLRQKGILKWMAK